MISRRVLDFTAWIAIVVGSFAAQKTMGGRQLLWSREVLQDLTGSRSTSNPVLLDENRAGVVFLNNEELIIHEVNQDLQQLSSRESPAISSPFRLHLLVLDANTGKTGFEKDWGTRVHDSSVQVTTGGVLIKTGEIVKLYSSDFIKAREVPVDLDTSHKYFTKVSASGKTIAISHVIQSEQTDFLSHIDVIDANTLSLRRSWEERPPVYSAFSISDKRISIGYSNGRVVAIADFGSSEWNTILNNSKSKCLADNPSLVSDDTIVVRNCGKELLLWTAKQGFSSLGPLGGRMSEKMAVSRTGRFVAVSLDTVETKRHLLSETTVRLTSMRVAVYDLALKKAVFTVNVDPLPMNDYDFALSPDGSKLAILNDRKLSVHSVIDSSVEKTRTP
jgi:hypothetical protein